MGHKSATGPLPPVRGKIPPVSTAPSGFLRVAAACPPVRVADPGRTRTRRSSSVANAAEQKAPGAGAARAGARRLHLRRPVLQPVDAGGGCRARARRRCWQRPAHADGDRASGCRCCGRPAVQRRRGDPGGRSCWASCRRPTCPATRSTTRSAGSPPRATRPAARCACAGHEAPFGTDLLFRAGEAAVAFGVEICEDLWSPVPPSSSRHAVAGATRDPEPLRQQRDGRQGRLPPRAGARSSRGGTLCGYVYANAGVHESTTDVVFGGQLLIAENATLLAEGERFARDGELVVSEIDVERLTVERARQTSFADGHATSGPATAASALAPDGVPPPPPGARDRPAPVRAHGPARRSTPAATRCSRSRRRGSPPARARRRRRVVLGLSGGLDSTLALLVCVRTFDLLGLPRAGIHAVTLPGPGTPPRTLATARGAWPRPTAPRCARSTSGRRLRAATDATSASIRTTAAATPTRTCRPASAPRS